MNDINSRIDVVIVGITTRCNGKCNFCARTIGCQYDKGIIDLDLDLILNPLLSKIEYLNFIGGLGDAMFHPEFLSFLKKCRSNYPKLHFGVNTNGSMNDIKFWRELGVLGNLQITFCVDGLEDTNHIYRHVDFNKIINNLKTYIKHGGKAVWQFIIFKYNAHQIEEVEELAKSLGCSEFIAIRSVAYTRDFPGPEGLKSRDEILESMNSGTIDCYWRNRNSISINEYGEVHPCCHLGPYFKTEKYSEIRDVYLKYKDSLSLYRYDIDTVLKSPYIKYIYDNFDNISVCRNTCGFSRRLRPYIERVKHTIFEER